MEGFDPKIVAFSCNWCAYAGADLAGTSRIQYPPNVRIIRVMCSGRVDPIIILQSFEKGADGVLVVGCHLGDCHYVKGNLVAEKRIMFIKNALSVVGIAPERLRLEYVSASEGKKFASVIENMTAELKKLGPLME